MTEARLVVVIVEAWTGALLRLMLGTSDEEHVHFMEGPYTVEVTHLPSGGFQLRAIERPNREHSRVTAHSRSLVESILGAAESVLEACRRAGHRSTDVDRLAAAVPALRREAAALLG